MRRTLDIARAKEIKQLYRDGMTLNGIGEKFGLTRQRVYQIAIRDYDAIEEHRRNSKLRERTYGSDPFDRILYPRIREWAKLNTRNFADFAKQTRIGYAALRHICLTKTDKMTVGRQLLCERIGLDEKTAFELEDVDDAV